MIYLIGFICHLTYILFDYFYFFTFFLDLNRLFAILEVITITNKLKKEMQDKKPLILLNTTPESNPTYRVLLQTPRELPAYDMGYNSIKYNPDTIKSKIKQLEGQFIYDETQTAHNKRKTPENRGHRFAKVINTGYCPEYGGYGDITVFDSDYHDLLKEVYESTRDGLPVHEGISTELDPIDAHTTNDGGGLVVDDWNYAGLVWDKNPRDNVGVCKVLNSIKDVLEDKNMDKDFKIERTEYDELKQYEADNTALKAQIATLLAEKKEGKNQWIEAKQKYDDLLAEKNDLHTQLIPVWNKQGEQKMEMVNSILETVPEKEQEAQRVELEKLGVTELGIIVNNLPSPPAQQHGVTGGSGTGRNNSNNDDFDPKTDETMKQLEKMGYF